jgi:hypothetical protein
LWTCLDSLNVAKRMRREVPKIGHLFHKGAVVVA